MPSYRVSGTTLSLSRFEAVGQDGAEKGFVGHAGLAEAAGLQGAASIPVLDMGPPLHGHDIAGRVRGDVVGSAALTDDEAQKIKTFVDRHANEHALFSQFGMSQLIKAAPQMYCVLPHVSPLYEGDGRYARTRFSCAGFVLEAYTRARIRLLNLNGLPMVDMAIIAAAYPQTRFIERGMISAEDLGLGGEGPWPVLLCGYLFHALNRETDVIRQTNWIVTSFDESLSGSPTRIGHIDVPNQGTGPLRSGGRDIIALADGQTSFQTERRPSAQLPEVRKTSVSLPLLKLAADASTSAGSRR